MILSASVMAHPARAAAVSRLRLDLGLDNMVVSWDTEGPASRDPDRIWRTARRGWDAFSPSADWHLLLQDDAVVCDDLLIGLSAALEVVPDEAVVSLYVGTGRPLAMDWEAATRRADEAGAAWIVGPRPMWGVALALPTALIPKMISWGDRQHGIPDDMRIGRWAKANRLETWYTWPSLVDHPDGGSLAGHGEGRTARRFVGHLGNWDPRGPVVHWGMRRR